MPKKVNSKQIEKLVQKIVIAREIEKKLKYDSGNTVLQAYHLRLKEISDKTDLAYNDVIVKKAKLRDASVRMNELEKQLDELISELGKFQSSELAKDLYKLNKK